jgi:hypothetical protein
VALIDHARDVFRHLLGNPLLLHDRFFFPHRDAFADCTVFHNRFVNYAIAADLIGMRHHYLFALAGGVAFLPLFHLVGRAADLPLFLHPLDTVNSNAAVRTNISIAATIAATAAATLAAACGLGWWRRVTVKNLSLGGGCQQDSHQTCQYQVTNLPTHGNVPLLSRSKREV